MNQQSGPQDSLVLSYLDLRKAVGIIGFALPFVLALGKILLQGHGIQSSDGTLPFFFKLLTLPLPFRSKIVTVLHNTVDKLAII